MLELKNEIKLQNWLFPILGPKVKTKMLEKLNIDLSFLERSSFTYLSSNIYRPSGLISEFEKFKCSPFTPVFQQDIKSIYIETQFNLFFKAGSLASESEINSKFQLYLNEFNVFCSSNHFYKSLPLFIEYILFITKVKFRGASHPHFLSTLILQLKEVDTKFDFFVSLIHEIAHQELFLLNFVDRLINSKYDYNLIHAPYQNKLRPPIGRLHSLHALFRMLQFVIQFEINNSKYAFFKTKFLENLSSFDQGELTDFSKFLMKELYGPFSEKL